MWAKPHTLYSKIIAPQSYFFGILLSIILLFLAISPHLFPLLILIAFVPIFYVIAANHKTRFSDASASTLLVGTLTYSLATPYVANAIEGMFDVHFATANLWTLAYAAVTQFRFFFLGAAAFSAVVLAKHISEKFPPLNQNANLIFWGTSFCTIIDLIFPNLWGDQYGHVFAYWQPASNWFASAGLGIFSFFVYLFNWSLVSVLISGFKVSKKFPIAKWILSSQILILLLMFISSSSFPGGQPVESKHMQLRLGYVQHNIGDSGHYLIQDFNQEQASQYVVDQLLLLSESLVAKSPDAIVWGETAYPGLIETDISKPISSLQKQLMDFVHKHKMVLIFGGFHKVENKIYNASFVMSPKGIHTAAQTDADHSVEYQVYHKRKLFPFGEYIPFSDHFPILKSWFPQQSKMSAGNTDEPLSLNINNQKILFQPLNCYEDLFSDLARTAKDNGAQFLLVLGNDYWFQHENLSHMHMMQGRPRSLETRLPQLRVQNTGISALIDGYGNIQNLAQWDTVGAGVVELNIKVH